MSVYRLLLLNHDGKVVETGIIECPDDARAMAEAEKLAPWYCGIEVWHGPRVVGCLEVEGKRREASQ